MAGNASAGSFSVIFLVIRGSWSAISFLRTSSFFRVFSSAEYVASCCCIWLFFTISLPTSRLRIKYSITNATASKSRVAIATIKG